MPVRFKVPAGVTSLSAQGIEFVVDEDGMIEVPDGTPEAALHDLQSPHGHNLKAEPDDPVAMANASVDMKKRTEKRLLRDLLILFGRKVDGRSQISWLRDQVVEAFKAAPVADEPAADADQPAAGRGRKQPTAEA